MMAKTLRLIGVGLMGLALLSACSSMTGRTAGRYIDDKTMTAKVKAKLATEDRLSTLTRINVATNNGIVTLSGIVPDQTSKDRADQIVSTTEGVQGVNDLLQVQGQPAASTYQAPVTATAPPPPPYYVKPAP
jgi:hyperosmotically inducible periplasmic protein